MMPFGEYDSMEDCISKNPDKKNPAAWCATAHFNITGKWPSEAYRHPDFEKIYKQFLTREDGENRYHEWVQALNLDETKPYGQSQKEQFRWVRRHVDFNLWKEDMQAKYWQVEAGFPLESMNLNVYSEQELIESARTIKGKTVNVNHKFQLPTIEIVAGKWEDGVVESVLRVPKNLRCPVCSEKKTVNDLIESNGIVNVSLEAVCTLQGDDPAKCEGMEFTGLALLTKDTLPGIPLTRLMPLEHIMVEALQSSTKTENRKMKKKLKLEVLEEDEPEPCPEGQKRNPETGECEPVSTEQVTQVVPVTGEPIDQGTEPDEHGQCPEGKMINALGKCVAIETCPENSHWSAEANDGHGGCVPDTVPKPETPETAVGTSPAPQEDVLTMGPTEQPTPEEQPPVTGTKKIPSTPAAGEQPAVTGDSPEVAGPMKPTAPGDIKPKPAHTCPDGQHYDYDLDQCVPNHPITERVKRFKAEDKAAKLEKNLELLIASWEERYVKLDTRYQQLLGTCRTQKAQTEDLKHQVERTQLEREDLRVEARTLKTDHSDKVREYKQLSNQFEDLTKVYNEQNEKYQKLLVDARLVVEADTKNKEEWMQVTLENERLKEALKRAKIHAKKTIKIKA